MENQIVDLFVLLLAISGLYVALGLAAGVADKLAQVARLSRRNRKEAEARRHG